VGEEVIGVIPSRWSSTRFPGKPLAPILGKPMIQHVYERARECRLLDELLVATDDSRIKDAAESFGAKVAVTSADHVSGTDRVREAVSGSAGTVIVNIQGDEPLLCSESVDELVREMAGDQSVGMATLACRIDEKDELDNRSCVKVVFDARCDALYFSRSRIPFVTGDRPFDYYKHIGVYGFRRRVLEEFASSPPGPLEIAEGLEQLRAVEKGIKIRVVRVRGWGPSVDTPADIGRVEEMLRMQASSQGEYSVGE
jgi:3-deoxy-manno-octulosonate cytidylyltransferase (CMP-KDO synthetase)